MSYVFTNKHSMSLDTIDNDLYHAIKYIVQNSTVALNKDIVCQVILYWNYLCLKEFNEPGVYTNILVMRERAAYSYLIEFSEYDDILHYIVRNDDAEATIPLNKLVLLSEALKQLRLSGDKFEDLIQCLLHTNTMNKKLIVDIPRVFFFACSKKSEYPILLSRLERLFEEKTKSHE